MVMSGEALTECLNHLVGQKVVVCIGCGDITPMWVRGILRSTRPEPGAEYVVTGSDFNAWFTASKVASVEFEDKYVEITLEV